MAARPGRSRVAYLTRFSNTRVFAKALSRELPADLFEIRAADPYPEDYFAHVERARRERDARATPDLASDVASLDPYRTIYLGFLIWVTELPAPVRTFVIQHDFEGKTLVPFVTHGKYGAGSSLSTLADLTPGARRMKPFVLECDQGRRQLSELDDWLSSVQAAL
ncbi:flavodoxin [Breoghania sp.]|uniref:flavodoxin n=1 Tax=Breoghania sp. TaxID=2065378 RepID=UPI002616EC13|nr:flavodoxin [Breoghania sp.]MDJ0930570.1 flavodoxin [Breoghania sp.]